MNWVAMAVIALLVQVNYQPHAPIAAHSNNDFSILGQPNLANGVRSGQGTFDSPYTISDWLIISPGTTVKTGPGDLWQVGIPGITISDTTAHVEIVRNRIDGTPPPNYPQGIFRPPLGVYLQSVHNVTIDFLYLKNFADGIVVIDSVNITLRHLNFSDMDGSQLEIIRSTATVDHSSFRGGAIGIQMVDADVTVRESNFENHWLVGVLIVQGTAPVDLRYNWWGDPRGPDWGDRVEGPLIFSVEPWLTSPAADAGYSGDITG